MRHAERCVFWKAPAASADHENSLTDAYVSTPPGKMLVYRMGVTTSTTPPPINKVALMVAARLGGALVQWPSGPKTMPNRTWLYAIQKPRGAA